jgi:hypothetical protein
MNKTYCFDSIIDFGRLKGEKMFMIYRFQIEYLEWLIRDTNICFSDLSAFYKFGKIKKINPNLSSEKEELLIEEILKNPNLGDKSKFPVMSNMHLNNLIEKGQWNNEDFIEIDHHFSKELFMINAAKFSNSSLYVSNSAIENIYNHTFFYDN